MKFLKSSIFLNNFLWPTYKLTYILKRKEVYSMPVTKSILRYPGGKTQLAKFVNNLITINKIKKPIYCEPFSGGSGVSMELLLTNKVKSIILNDYDPAIYSIWNAVLQEPGRLIAEIENCQITMDNWYIQKEIYTRYNNIREYNFDLAFATLFLNRTNRGGIITGGPIGGYNQNSKYQLDCRFNRKDIINKIRKISDQHHRIQLYMMDAEELVRNVLLKLNPEQLFTFFDPPYYHQGQALYKSAFDHNNHVSLSHSISTMHNYKWITTYDECNEIREIYNEYPLHTYQLRYSVRTVRFANEYIFSSPVTKLESFDKVQIIN